MKFTSLSDFPKTVFVGQPEYFRQSYYDATHDGFHKEFQLKNGHLEELNNLYDFIKQNDIKVCVMYRPEWFLGMEDTFKKIKALGVKMVGYSTEPIPAKVFGAHKDQKVRLKSLKKGRHLAYDLIIHFDRSCKNVVEKVFPNRRLAYLPLAVSDRIFYPEQNDYEWDICFIGRPTPYRERFCTPLKQRFNFVHIAHGLSDDWARFIMSRSKMVLNLHNLNYLNFEVRAIQALYMNSCLLSHPLTDAATIEGTDISYFKTREEMVDLVKAKLENKSYEGLNFRDKYVEQFHVNRLFDIIKSSIL